MCKETIYTLVVIFTLSLLKPLFSENNWLVKAGFNYSAFRDNDDELIGNYSLGISRNIDFTEKLSLLPDFLISSQGGMLRNKPVWTDNYELALNSYSYRVAIQLIEFGLMINYQILDKSLELSLNIGPSWRIGLHDESHKFNRKLIYDDTNPTLRDEFENYNFKYISGDPSFINSSGWSVNLGLMCSFKRICFETRYSFALHDIGAFSSLEKVGKKSHTLHFLIGVLL